MQQRGTPVTPPARRRNNAPVRPRRPATSVPDMLFAIGSALLTMAVIFFIASFVHEDLSSGDAGTDLARIFAATLTLSAILMFLLGLLLLRDERARLDHYLVPILLGIAAGALEAWLFLEPRGAILLLLPLLLLVFAFRPLRRAIAGVFGQGGPR